MELLDLTNLGDADWYGITFTQDKKGVDLYYNKYKYRVCIRFKCISRARYYNSVEHFKSRLNANLYAYTLFGTSSSVTVGGQIIHDGGNIDDLCKFITWKNKRLDKSVKITTSGNYITFYFNEINIIKDFLELYNHKFVAKGSYRLRIPNFEKGVVYLKKPEYRLRLYLQNIKMEYGDAENFKRLFSGGGVKACPSLCRTVNSWGAPSLGRSRPYAWVYNNNFIDFNDEQFITLVALTAPQFIKKVCRIEPR